MINKRYINAGRYWDRAWTLVDGCSPCSPGCDNCWSAAMAHRFKREGGPGHSNGILTDDKGKFNGDVVTRHERLDIPLKTRTPTVFAVWNDLFHEAVPDIFIAEALAVAALSPRHTFLILTKRAERMNNWFSQRSGQYSNGAQLAVYGALSGLGSMEKPQGFGFKPGYIRNEMDSLFNTDRWPLPNVYHGLTVCNQTEADEKIPIFSQVPGKTFLSIEPMLERINLFHVETIMRINKQFPTLLQSIECVILGGETSAGARPMHPDWVRKVRNDCASAGVPFFFKQWGTVKLPRNQHGNTFADRWDMVQAGCDPSKKSGGRVLDGRTHDDLPWVKEVEG